VVGVLEAHRRFVFGCVVGVDRVVHGLGEIVQVTRQCDDRLVDRLAGPASLSCERASPDCGGDVVARRRDGHRLQSAGQVSRAVAQDFEVPFFDDKIAGHDAPLMSFRCC
jgi:hypothetical protein